MMDDFGKKHVKGTIDATDKASKKAKTASANVNKLNGKKPRPNSTRKTTRLRRSTRPTRRS